MLYRIQIICHIYYYRILYLNVFLRVFFALAFCAASVGQTSAYLQDYSRAKIAASLIFQLIRRKSEIDPLSNSGSKPVRPYHIITLSY